MQTKINPSPELMANLREIFYQRQILEKQHDALAEKILRESGNTNMSANIAFNPGTWEVFAVEPDVVDGEDLVNAIEEQTGAKVDRPESPPKQPPGQLYSKK